MKRLLAASFGIVLFVACTGDQTPVDGVATGIPTASATPTSMVTAKSTPWVEPLPPALTPTPRVIEIGESVTLEFKVSSHVRLVVYEPVASEQEEWWWQKLYEVDADVLWTVADDEGTPYSLRFGPEADRGIGTATGAGWSLPGETVLVDLVSGEVTELLPYPATVVSWLEPDRVLLRLLQGRDRDGVASELRLGSYELDLATQVLTLVSREPNYREVEGDVPVPAGSVLPEGATLEYRYFTEEYWAALVARDDVTGTEEVVVDRLAGMQWAPDGRVVALARVDRELRLFDPVTTEVRGLGTFGKLAELRWSADSRYLVLGYYRGDDGPERDVVVFDLGDLGWVRVLGPFEQSIFADWGPGLEPSALLLLGEYCQEGGFWLDRVDLPSGELRRLSTGGGGFWAHDWSPRGDLIAVSSRGVDGGFALLGAETGAREERPLLDAVVTSMQDIVWSASGDWIALGQIGGRDRCWV